jgi:predicted DCC family thiol-disulfide oxidoreductase YuxK
VIRVFYDGTCGLCHGFVVFLLRRDPNGAFRFAPLQGETFRKEVPEAKRAGLPDTVVVVPPDGRILIRSDAALLAFEALGGGWAAFAKAARIVPRFLRDAVYDLVAASRRKLFRKPDDVCPVVPANLRNRFEP